MNHLTGKNEDEIMQGTFKLATESITLRLTLALSCTTIIRKVTESISVRAFEPAGRDLMCCLKTLQLE